MSLRFFFFNDTATTEIYTLSLHDALPIWDGGQRGGRAAASRSEPSGGGDRRRRGGGVRPDADRKSTRLNSSHDQISYAVFCLKKKKHFWMDLYAPVAEWVLPRISEYTIVL